VTEWRFRRPRPQIEYQNYLRQPILDVQRDGTAIRSLAYYRYGNDTGRRLLRQVTLIAHSKRLSLTPSRHYYNDSLVDLGLGGTDSIS